MYDQAASGEKDDLLTLCKSCIGRSYLDILNRGVTVVDESSCLDGTFVSSSQTGGK